MSKAEEEDLAAAAFWNGPVGSYWVTRQEAFDAVLAPVGTAAMDRAKVESGNRVIDVGCGCGTTTIELARRVGSKGHVLGIDISKPMLAWAAQRVGPTHSIEFVEADVTTHRFRSCSYDVLFSRLGVMFFRDPPRAFTNMRGALCSGARVSLACFRNPQDSPYLLLPLRAAHNHVAPRPKPGPEDPGTFSFASEERVHRILGAAGFKSIRLEPLDLELDLAGGRGLDAAVETSVTLGPTGGLLLDQPDEIRAAVAISIRDALAPYERDGSVRLRGGFWIVSASTG